MDGVKSTLNRVVSAEFELPAFLSSGAKDLINCLLKKVSFVKCKCIEFVVEIEIIHLFSTQHRD